jgi:hypothetical protein
MSMGSEGKVYTHGDRPCAFSTDLGFDVLVRTLAGIDIYRFGGIGDNAVRGVRGDQFAFTTIPLGEDLS